eukprot:6179386-Pleurochrysis_carterae.AAC.4
MEAKRRLLRSIRPRTFGVVAHKKNRQVHCVHLIPPPLSLSLSMQFEGIAERDRNDEMPSGRENGPEDNRRTQRDDDVSLVRTLRSVRGAGDAASVASV